MLSPLALLNPRAASAAGSGGAEEAVKTTTEAAAGGGASSSPASSSLPRSSSSSSSSSPAPWFSETGDPLATPLRWHFPVGVLADAAVARRGKRGSGRRGNDDNDDDFFSSSAADLSSSPWPLTIHFSRYPASVLPPWRVASAAAAAAAAATTGGETGKRAFPSSSASSTTSSISSLALREAFFNSLKEAACAATGSAARVLAMPGAAAERLWAAAEAGDAEAASAAVSRALRDGSGGESEGGGDGGGEGPLPPSSGSVPLRLAVVAPAAGESLRDPHCAFEVVCTSRPVAKSRSRGGGGGGEEGGGKEVEETAAAATTTAATTTTTTLGEALLEALPKLPGKGGDPESPAWTLDPSSGGHGLLLRGKSARVLVAGLDVAAAATSAEAEAAAPKATAAGSAPPPQPPLSSSSLLPLLLAAPLPWVHARLSACDQFLYVVVRAPEPL